MASPIDPSVFERVAGSVGVQRRCGREVDLFSPLHCWLAVRVPHQTRNQQSPPTVQVSYNRSSHTLFPKLVDIQTSLVADLIDQFSYHVETVEKIASYFLDTTIVLSLHVVPYDELSTEEKETLTEAQQNQSRVCIHTAICVLGHTGTEPNTVERTAALATLRDRARFKKVQAWLEQETQRLVLFSDVPVLK